MRQSLGGRIDEHDFSVAECGYVLLALHSAPLLVPLDADLAEARPPKQSFKGVLPVPAAAFNYLPDMFTCRDLPDMPTCNDTVKHAHTANTPHVSGVEECVFDTLLSAAVQGRHLIV